MTLRSSVYGWKSVWMDFAEEKSGDFVEGQKEVTVRVPVANKPWAITFSMLDRKAPAPDETTAQMAYKAKDDFSFAIHSKTWVAEAGKLFGMQDIEVGDAEFDRDYIIKGNDIQAVRTLFSSDDLRERIREQKSIRLVVLTSAAQLKEFGNVPKGTHVLSFTENEAINSFERLNEIYELLVKIAEKLTHMGKAVEADPGIEI